MVAERPVTMLLQKSSRRRVYQASMVACHQVYVRNKCPIRVCKTKSKAYVFMSYAKSRAKDKFLILFDKVAFPF